MDKRTGKKKKQVKTPAKESTSVFNPSAPPLPSKKK